ncbi:KAP-like P-loop domain-containing protein [Streptomyces sp. 2333.5]|uniref:KAP family P-loop NTPase fold protein n=1 Tax=unclassified Streptomyces TaxID=2593676 RepID=UPI00089CCF96|nr:MULTISPECIES: P-loop NTPase fold protein [unclassified Streptomyces]PJJ04101.1 KAP-like P-loop domain-containing protein [Streptomyces sp. 2333.5]SEE42433.1 KAP family P-loop domain-containing protein [Streptomyces sp. 2314.4]SEE67944.1 KAP family P-loop domain-containing protein [Streptomyces sp. 2112.2]
MATTPTGSGRADLPLPAPPAATTPTPSGSPAPSTPAPTPPTRFALLNDEPVTDSAADLLGTGRAARQLAGLLVASRASTPFTLAVDAGWGMGKSTLMRLVDAELAQAPEVHTVWFNAWSSTATDALEGLIKSVLMRFDRRVLRRGLQRLSERRALLRAARALTTLAAGPLGVAGLVDELWKSLSVDSQARNEMRGAIGDLVQEWSQTDGLRPRRLLVVFIDDLDRCEEEVVLKVCEAVKVSLDVPGLAFVIGCDRSALAPNGLLRDLSPAASAFMEKIFQTSYRIPVADQQGVREYIGRCARSAGIDHILDERLTTLLAERSARNPRRIKRLVNGFVLEATLNPMWDDFPPEAVVRTLLLQYFYPDFYRMVAGAPGAGTGDVIAEFRTYRQVRRLLRTPDPLPAAELPAVTRFLREHDLPEQDMEPREQTLSRLERQLPSGFPEMVTDQEFTSLLDGLVALDRSAELLRRLREGAELPADVQPEPAPYVATAASHVPSPGFDPYVSTAGSRVSSSGYGAPPAARTEAPGALLRGVNILWVDDCPSNNVPLAGRLRAAGAVVRNAEDSEAADAALAVEPPTLIVSDIDRGSNPREGLEHIGRVRREGRFTGPVIFYTGRVTPERRSVADELQAHLTNSAAEVERLVLRHAGPDPRFG